MKYKKTIWFLIFFLFFWPGVSLAQFTYTPMEKIPGYESQGTDFKSYIVSIYKFGIWTIGICALLMILIGGIMYMTSAGNTASMGKAKGIIYDAIIGFLLAMSSFLILNTINPELLKIKIITGGTSGGNPNKNMEAGPTGPQTPTPYTGDLGKGKNCDELNAALAKGNSSGVDPRVLKTIAAGGEGTGKDGKPTCNKGNGDHGSCGYFQVQQRFRESVCGFSGCPADATQDVECGAKFIKQEMYGVRKCGETDLQCIGAYYNDSGNCSKTTRDYCGRLQRYWDGNFKT